MERGNLAGVSDPGGEKELMKEEAGLDPGGEEARRDWGKWGEEVELRCTIVFGGRGDAGRG